MAAFYSFAYCAAHRFDAGALLGRRPWVPAEAFWPTFFRGSAVADYGPGAGTG